MQPEPNKHSSTKFEVHFSLMRGGTNLLVASICDPSFVDLESSSLEDDVNSPMGKAQCLHVSRQVNTRRSEALLPSRNWTPLA